MDGTAGACYPGGPPALSRGRGCPLHFAGAAAGRGPQASKKAKGNTVPKRIAGVYEWLFASMLLLALAILAGRKGFLHLLGRRLRWGIMAAGALAGWMVESLPLSRFPAPPSVTTALAIVTGLLAARLVARGMTGWARGQQRDVASGHAPADGRLAHPLIGAGLVLLGSPLLYALVAARHESLEVDETPRDARTQVVLGAEDRRLAGDPAKSHGVLLVHGYLGSPADLGDLPDRLHAQGFTVRVLRLPAHGTAPGVLEKVAPGEYLEAVRNARKELAAAHERVSLVGFSFGGALSLLSAAEETPHRLVLVNPWFGPAATPAWSPVETDTLMEIAAHTLVRVIRPPGMDRVNDPAGRARLRTYWTVPTKPSLVAQGVARTAAAPQVAAAAVRPPLLVLRSRDDRSAPPAVTEAWFRALPGDAARRREVVYERSDHCLFVDHDGPAAIAEIERFLADGDR